jgi:hypothetical protein
VDANVCRLQDSSFQISLGPEGAMPVWVGMRWLETRSWISPIQQYTADIR